MPLSEFELIERYFNRNLINRSDVILGIGDDAAIVRVPDDRDCAVATDTMLAGVHFPASVSAEDLGYRALAVNLSDLAAVGAEPAWATLALTIPEADPQWLENFARGFLTLAAEHGVQLIGGDVTRGPLSITVTIQGLLPRNRALRRSGARPGDLIYVSGTLGDAALGLQYVNASKAFPAEHGTFLAARFFRPVARVELGRALLDVATSAIDISDGLSADLGHILDSSHVGATVEVSRLPLSAAMRSVADTEQALRYALSGGDDYELCCTVPPSDVSRIEAAGESCGCAVTCVGVITAMPGLRLLKADRSAIQLDTHGYHHF